MRFILALTLAAWPAFSMAEGHSDAEAEMSADEFSARTADVEWVLRNTPALIQDIVNDALREDPDTVKAIIRETLLRNPDIVVGALQEFQRQQQAGTAAAPAQQSQSLPADLLADMRSGDNAHVGGNPGGTATIVEFFDYNCSFCRRFAPILDELKAENDHLRIVYREWPVLGQDSVDVARLALAAREQGAYEAIHDAFMSADGQLTAERALEIAEDLGLNTEKLEADAQRAVVTAHFDRSVALAEQVNFQGTPSMLVGDRLARGLVGADAIQPILDRFKVD